MAMKLTLCWVRARVDIGSEREIWFPWRRVPLFLEANHVLDITCIYEDAAVILNAHGALRGQVKFLVLRAPGQDPKRVQMVEGHGAI